MSKILKVSAVGLWMVAGTIFLSRLWYANPDRFPHFPESFWRYLDQLFGATNVDDAQNVELVVVVAASLVAVAVLTAIAVALAAYFKRKREE